MMTVDCSDDFPSSFILIMVMDYQEGMNHSRNPQKEAQKQIQQGLYRLPAEKNCNRREKKS
jgi:hypothetical protein